MFSTVHYAVFCFFLLSINVLIQADVESFKNDENGSCHLKSMEERLFSRNYHHVPILTRAQLTSCSFNRSNIMKYWYTFNDLCGANGNIENYFASVKSDGSRQCKSSESVKEKDCNEKFDFTYESMIIRNMSIFMPTDYICLCVADTNMVTVNNIDSSIVHSIKRSAAKDTSADVTSYYYGALSTSSSTFLRPGASSGRYYYTAIRVSITVSGTYAVGSSSTIDLYGYFYDGNFNPSSPWLNLINQDDDSLGGGQFALGGPLLSGRTYTLVVTTHGAGSWGSFTITAVGPGTINIGGNTSSTTITQAFTNLIVIMAMVSIWNVFL